MKRMKTKLGFWRKVWLGLTGTSDKSIREYERWLRRRDEFILGHRNLPADMLGRLVRDLFDRRVPYLGPSEAHKDQVRRDQAAQDFFIMERALKSGWSNDN